MQVYGKKVFWAAQHQVTEAVIPQFGHYVGFKDWGLVPSLCSVHFVYFTSIANTVSLCCNRPTHTEQQMHYKKTPVVFYGKIPAAVVARISP